MSELDRIQRDVERELERVRSLEELEDIRVRVLGEKGELTILLQSFENLSPEERDVLGSKASELRRFLEEAIRSREDEILGKN